MNNKYILLRHGETKYQEQGIDMIYTKKENTGISLTKEAMKRLKKVAQELKHKNIDIIYSSPYKRTKQTAEIVARGIGAKIIFDKRLIDINLGVLHGGSTLGYYEIYIKEKNLSNKAEGGESWAEVQKRVADFIKEIDKKYKDKTILIVSHGDPIWFLVGFIKELSIKEFFKKRGKYFGEYKGFYPATSQFIEP